VQWHGVAPLNELHVPHVLTIAMKDQVTARPELPWIDPLLATLQLKRGDTAEVVYEFANDKAEKLAPNTRRLWRWVLLLEGMAVLLPLLWLRVAHMAGAVGLVACAVAFCTLTLVATSWWMRGKNLQHTWARSRLLAEIARSAKATAGWPVKITREALGNAPSLQPIADVFTPAAVPDADADLETLKAAYIKNRIDDQYEHYRKKAERAAVERKRLSAYVTHALDAALFLAVVGVGIAFVPNPDRWLKLYESDVILGVIGAALPLTAILMQSLSSYLEISRRTGRYVQQLDFLDHARASMKSATDLPEAVAVVREVERGLISEVLEWFYQTEHAEVFYRNAIDTRKLPPRNEITIRPEGWFSRAITGLMQALGLSLGFVGRVIFGRILVIALSSVLTAALIFYRAPHDVVQRSELRLADGQLLSSAKAKGWEPRKERSAHGFMLIAHGLHDSALLVQDEDVKPVEGKPVNAETEVHWMTRLQRSVEGRLKEDCPDICLVDWGQAAKPSSRSIFDFGERRQEKPVALQKSGETHPEVEAEGDDNKLMSWLQDVPAIRPQAQAIGDMVGYKLASAIHDGLIKQDQPMHFIGHSAGGFVVVRAALILKRLKILPSHLQVTMLDTPAPDHADLEALLKDILPGTTCTVEFYLSSSFAQNVPEDGRWPSYHMYPLQLPVTEKGLLNAHSYAHKWFIKTVSPRPEAEPWEKMDLGFAHSPFLGR